MSTETSVIISPDGSMEFRDPKDSPSEARALLLKLADEIEQRGSDPAVLGASRDAMIMISHACRAICGGEGMSDTSIDWRERANKVLDTELAPEDFLNLIEHELRTAYREGLLRAAEDARLRYMNSSSARLITVFREHEEALRAEADKLK